MYIGRPSPLGNPFKLAAEAERDAVCDAYDRWLEQQVAEQNPQVLAELGKLAAQAKQTGRLTLGCYCTPKRCHGESIKRVLEALYGLGQDTRLAY